MSMKKSGKSRADLWAFAGLVSVYFGIDLNNKACKGTQDTKCKSVFIIHSLIHVLQNIWFWLETNSLTVSCGHMQWRWLWNQSFQTGRVDCQPDANSERPFFTSRAEIHPNAHGNGIATVNYYKENFGITAREAIALTEGAHSYGKPNRQVSFNSYSWTDNQELLLNNQMFRELVLLIFYSNIFNYNNKSLNKLHIGQHKTNKSFCLVHIQLYTQIFQQSKRYHIQVRVWF